MSKQEDAEGVWEFTFMVVQAGEDEAQALSAALYYLGEMADKEELEPTQVRRIE